MQQDNQNIQGNKRADQLRKPMESQANKPAMGRSESDLTLDSDRETPPQTGYNQEKHWAADSQQQAGIQQDFQTQQNAGDVQSNQVQERGQDYEQNNTGAQSQRNSDVVSKQNADMNKPHQQANRPTEDHSKSFGESEVPGGGEVDHSDDDGVIPKENSFPQFSKPSGEAGAQTQGKQDYTH